MTSPCRYKAYRHNKDRENEKRRREQDLFYALEYAEVERAKKMKKKR